MKSKSPHEPEAEVMNAEDVRADAENLSRILRQNLLKENPKAIPLSAILDLVDHLDHSDLRILKARVEERLTI